MQLNVRSDAQRLLPELVELRRALHADPEIGLDLPRTQQRVLDALADLPLEITVGRELSSVVAVLRGAHEGPAVLLRGDMDGLPVEEDTGLPYASTNGNMHACGHDLHTVGLVGAAKLLAERRSELHGSVIFMFQPGEEAYGGAAKMIAEGLLEVTPEPPVAAYGIHVAPGPQGVFEYRPGPALAGVSRLHITVNGKGGHGSQPETAVDPVPALVKIAGSLQEMIASKFPTFDPVVLTVTQLTAGQAINVIPDSAQLGATVRTLAPESIDLVRTHSKTLADGIAQSFGCTADVELHVQYPVTVNDRAETDYVARTLSHEFGQERVQQRRDPLMGSEDFSEVLNQVPGTFLFLAASPPEIDPESAPWNHSPNVLFDDAVLGDQAAALALLALKKLANS